MNLYRKTLSLLTPKEKRRGALVLGLVVIMKPGTDNGRML